MKVSILGTEYTIFKESHEQNKTFERKNWCGYCEEGVPEIHMLDLDTCAEYDNETKVVKTNYYNMTLRHEILHAFLNESGLMACANQTSGAWSKNEEMVDWIALQFPKILKAFQDVKCL